MASFLERLAEYVPAAWAPYYDRFAGLFLLGLDLFENGVEQVFQARIPGALVDDLGNIREDTLALHGRDRRIYRGPLEPGAAYAARLVDWAETWRTAGTALTLLRQLRALGSPTFSTLRLVTDSGVWYTLEAGGDFVINTPGGDGFRVTPAGVTTAEPDVAHPWDWDSTSFSPLLYTDADDYAEKRWSRYWIIVYVANAVITDDDGAYDDGLSVYGESVNGDPLTIGTNAAESTVNLYRAVVGEFGPAGITCDRIIIALDPDSFDPLTPGPYPAAGMPDGTWGHWGKYVTISGAIHRVRARLETARYWQGAPG